MSNELSTAIAHALRGAGGGKAGGKSRTPVEAPDSLRSTALARILDLVSEGEIVGPADPDHPLRCIAFNETPVEATDGSLNFKNVQIEFRPGTQTQDYVKGFSSTENEVAVGVELRHDQTWTQSFANLSLDAVRVRLSVAALSKTNTENGDTGGYNVNYAIDLNTDGGGYVNVYNGAFNGKTSTKYERTHRVELPRATTGWTIRVRRSTINTTSAAIQDKTYVESFAEIIDAKLRYPMSAYFATVIDAEQFQNIPSRAFRLKGRIIKVPSNYNAALRTYTGVWDGTFQVAYTNNPAWVFYDLATNSRYGMGNRVPAALIDKWNLYRIAQYCDEMVDDGFGGTEPRFTANLYLQTQEDAAKVMQDMATMFRGIMYVAGGAIMPVADMPEDPVYTYNQGNVIDGRFSYSGSSRRARHTVALVSWNDLSNMGRGKVEYVEDEDGLIRYGHQPTEVIAIGCTSRGQARRLGKYMLTTERYETDLVTFSVGMDGTIVAPGKIIKIADPLRAGKRMGGRIVSATANSVTVDLLPVGTVAGQTLTVHTPGGVAMERTIQSVVGSVVTVTAPFDAVPVAQSVWAVETDTLFTQRFRVLSVTENDDGVSYTISAVQHVEGKYAYVEQNIAIEEPPISETIGAVLLSPTNLTLVDTDVADDNTTIKKVELNWDDVPNATSYVLRYRVNNGTWVHIENITSSNYDLHNLLPGVIDVAVIAKNSLGESSPVYGTFDIAPNIKPPGFVEALNIDIFNALQTAENAQAAADGVIDTFWQNDPPAIGGTTGAKVGDIWYDTNDGNKIYRVVGSSWVLSTDDRIAQAIASAATAQATADGKVKLFVGGTAPVSGYQLNDLWFDTVNAATKRWNGAAWVTVADVTLDQISGNGINLLPDPYSTFEQASLPVGTSGGNASVSRVAGFITSAIRATAASNSIPYWYWEASNSAATFQHVAGKKYIVSAWVYSSVARAAGYFALYLRNTTTSVAYAANAEQAVPANTWTRISAAVDASASANCKMTAFTMAQSGAAAGVWFDTDGLMVEEQIGRKTTPSTYVRGTAAGVSISALLAAQTAQATADGNVDIYRQSAPPSIGGAGAKVGDYWQDTDDGRWYYCTGSSWVESTDNRLPQLVTDLQSTNNTVAVKTRLFYTEAQPTATALGDMWYQPSTKLTRYWNGSGWSLQADNSLETQKAATLVKDGGFEAGGVDWIIGVGGYIENGNNGYQGNRYLVIANGTRGAAISQSACDLFPVAVGDTIIGEAAVRNLGGNTAIANGAVKIWFYDINGTYVADGGNAYWTQGTLLGSGGQWKRCVLAAKAPANTAFARIGFEVAGAADGGYWIVDQVRAVRREKTDNMSANLCINSDFGGINGSYAPWGVTWNPQAASISIRNQRDTWTFNTSTYKRLNRVEIFQDGIATTGPYFFTDIGLSGNGKIPVAPSTRYEFQLRASAYRCNVDYQVYWYDAAMAYITEQVICSFSQNGGAENGPCPLGYGFITSPANAAYCYIGIRKGNTAAGQPNSVVFMESPYVGVASPQQTEPSAYTQGPTWSSDEMTTNATGVVNINDIYDPYFNRRLGLRVAGSGHRIGDQRNLPQSLTTAYGSVRNATALSANSSGQVSVNAHTVRYGGVSISYSAVTNAVVGLTPGATYVIYCLDPSYAGGVVTWYAGSNPDTVMQQGDGVVVAGQVTIPTSGTSTGGGSGGGAPGGGGDWCVDADMVLADGRVARDIVAGDRILCWNYDAETPRLIEVEVESNTIVEDQPCSYIVTEHFASVIASDSTPMSLRDGRIVRMPEMRGEYALVNRRGVLQWEYVREVGNAGNRPVAKIKVHQHCYFAGMYSEVTIATHNPIMKP